MNPPLKRRACPWQSERRMSSVVRVRDVRQHDGCPAAYVHRSGAVCVGSVPALDALEDRLRRPVGLRGVSALGTLSACVARVNEEYGDARALRLILDEGAQLSERPARESSTLLPSSPHPLANVPKVFQPIARFVRSASSTSSLLITWLMLRANLRSLPESFLRRRLAECVRLR
jgi:hypothetical protein